MRARTRAVLTLSCLNCIYILLPCRIHWFPYVYNPRSLDKLAPRPTWQGCITILDLPGTTPSGRREPITTTVVGIFLYV